ncbi:MAG: HIT family protein, partial [Candidatus Sericytochromatia bacterium]|nr:HIT family protein [Candidatus Sericytochromatia bacterium]
GCNRVSTVIAGWDVPHFHYHLIPTNSFSDLDFKKAKSIGREEMEKIQDNIIKILSE